MTNPVMYLIDPPEGAAYGFPKQCPEAIYLDKQQFLTWLVTQGYPQVNVTRYFNHLMFVQFPKV